MALWPNFNGLFHSAGGQPHRSLMNGREEKQHQEAAGQEANAAQHQRFNHPPSFPEKRPQVNGHLN
jgi:hypothetical protein